MRNIYKYFAMGMLVCLTVWGLPGQAARPRMVCPSDGKKSYFGVCPGGEEPVPAAEATSDNRDESRPPVSTTTPKRRQAKGGDCNASRLPGGGKVDCPPKEVVTPAGETTTEAASSDINTTGTNRALLIGIGAYKTFPLNSPPYDVAALKTILPQWGFTPQEITVLQDQEATRNGILAALTALGDRSKQGDKILVFFSGQGTSSEDQNFGRVLKIPYGLGAWAPVDLDNEDTPENMIGKLLLGDRDIHPLLEAIARTGVQVLVIADTPFFGCSAPLTSGNSNLVYLSASLNSQPAMSTSVDGNPHGAFTDALLHVLRGEVTADLNGDGELSPDELHGAFGPLVSSKYRQTPCISPAHGNYPNSITNHGFFKGHR